MDDMVNTRAKLVKRLNSARTLLRSDLRKHFIRGKNISFKEKCMYSTDGKMKLQWKIRHQQDTTGNVYFEVV